MCWGTNIVYIPFINGQCSVRSYRGVTVEMSWLFFFLTFDRWRVMAQKLPFSRVTIIDRHTRDILKQRCIIVTYITLTPVECRSSHTGVQKPRSMTFDKYGGDRLPLKTAKFCIFTQFKNFS